MSFCLSKTYFLHSVSHLQDADYLECCLFYFCQCGQYVILEKIHKHKTTSIYEPNSLVDLILTRATLMKRLTAYYQGLPELRQKMNWPMNKLHGVLNQCVAKTGRITSTKPNLQNFDGEIKHLFGSRYAVTS